MIDIRTTGKILMTLSLLCFSFLIIIDFYYIQIILVEINKYYTEYTTTYLVSLLIQNILSITCFAIIMLALILKKQRLLAVAAGACTVLWIYSSFFSLSNEFGIICIYYFSLPLAWGIFTFNAVFTVMSKPFPLKLWILPGLFGFFGFLGGTLIGNMIAYDVSLSILLEYYYPHQLLYQFFEASALVFSGLWFMMGRESDQIETTTASKQQYPPFTGKAPAAGDAEKIKKYKELLDSGAITQEDFDELKRKIFGLLGRESDQIKTTTASKPQYPPFTGKAPAAGDAEKIKKYKELLDSGAITQEDFDELKRKIFGL